jgi:hypothetical protein
MKRSMPPVITVCLILCLDPLSNNDRKNDLEFFSYVFPTILVKSVGHQTPVHILSGKKERESVVENPLLIAAALSARLCCS